MEINRLLSDELTYELQVRGASVDGTVEEKRARLRSRIRFENLGSFNRSFISDIQAASELEICKTKLAELTESLNNFKADKAKSERSRILSRLIHVEGRLNRIVDEEVRGLRETLLDECDKLFHRLDVLVTGSVDPRLGGDDAVSQPGTSRSVAEQSGYVSATGHIERVNPLPPETKVDQQLRALDFNESLSPQATGLDEFSPAVDNSRVFSIISKWGIFYDGISSLTNFITRVEELRNACGITKPQLLRAAVLLFKDSALAWYRAFGESSGSWDGLISRLRNTFLPSSYDEELWRDIRSRTQHNTEKSVIYIAVMENYFSLLRNRPEEACRVEIIRGNLLPTIQEKIGISEARQGPITTVAELLRVCQHFDEIQSRTHRYRPPPTNPNQVVEPGLMFREHRSNLNRSRMHAMEFSEEPLNMSPPESNQLPLVTSESQLVPIGRSFSPSVRETSAQPVNAISSGVERNRRSVVCFNCRQLGHVLKDCPSPRVRRCYRCGQLDQTVRTCPACSGNGRLGSGVVEPLTR